MNPIVVRISIELISILFILLGCCFYIAAFVSCPSAKIQNTDTQLVQNATHIDTASGQQLIPLPPHNTRTHINTYKGISSTNLHSNIPDSSEDHSSDFDEADDEFRPTAVLTKAKMNKYDQAWKDSLGDTDRRMLSG